MEKKYIPLPELARIGHGHISALQIEKHLPASNYDDFFSFAFVRNPFDRFISFSTFINRDNDQMKTTPLQSMKASFRNPRLMLHFLMRPQHEFITRRNGDIMISHIARWENMQSEFNYIRTRTGSAPIHQLPVVNSTNRGSYKDYYDTELRDLVVKHYAKDFEIFDYSTDL